MQRSRAAAPGGEHGCTAAERTLLRRERELVAQLHELLFPSSSPAPNGGGGGASWSSSSDLAADLSGEHCSPVKALPGAPASCGGGRRRRRGSKRVREDEQREEEQVQHGGGASAKATRCRRKKQGTTTATLVTTVPDFDGYQWRKYGQKQIEAAKYPRSYYRCPYSTDQGCPAKRTVQRNDGNDGGGDGGPPKYTVVYISEHSCKATEPVAPVILETTVRTKTPPAAPAVAVVPASSVTSSTGTQSPACSDITWSGGDANLMPSDYARVFAVDGDCWDPTATPAAAAAALLQEMDFAGPIRSPVYVHVAADGNWINDLFVNGPGVLNSCHLFGF